MWCVEKLQLYLYGKIFDVIVDHQYQYIYNNIYIIYIHRVDDDSSSAEVCLYLNHLSKMKVRKDMPLDNVMNESKKDPEILTIRNALLTDKWEK